MDPKRRRIEEPKNSGLIENIDTEDTDTDMTEEERMTNMVSENVKPVGSAMQTRQSL